MKFESTEMNMTSLNARLSEMEFVADNARSRIRVKCYGDICKRAAEVKFETACTPAACGRIAHLLLSELGVMLETTHYHGTWPV